MTDKYLNGSDVELLWRKIKKLIDKNTVTNADDSIVVDDGKIAVKISASESNKLELRPGEGLFVSSAPGKMHKLIFGQGDKTYTYDGSEDVIVPVYTGKY